MAEPRRISQTGIRPLAASHEDALSEGFRADLPGWDLATLLQMACARGERACVEIACGEQRGHVYMNEGRLVHASVGTVLGEPAIALMLSWRGGAFSLCDRPWPLKPTIDESVDVVLLRLAQARDEAAQRALPRVSAFARPQASAPATEEGPVLASVRIDMNGEIVAHQGSTESLAPLVGYVTRMGALLALQLGLEPFEALAADLGKQRALVYVEGDEMVGLLLGPGALHQELRQQLGF